MNNVWWNQITNARCFRDSVIQSVLDQKSVVLVLPKKIPWYDAMCELIHDDVTKRNSKNSFDYIKLSGEKPGEFLLNKYCKEEKRLSYRPGKSYARFLAESDDIVLNDKYIWVRHILQEQYDEWIEFIAEYNKYMRSDMTPAVFILELSDEMIGGKIKKGITKLVYDKVISPYDNYAFCALAATEISCKEFMRPYLAELVSNVCDQDVELCAQCVRHGKYFLESPAEVLNKIIKEVRRSDGSEFKYAPDSSFFNLKIWETQIKIVFPAIENYRSYFVKLYHDKIEKRLPIKNSNGEILTDPAEVEIGTLNYMVASGQFDIGEREYNKLHQLKEARNTLAHLKILSVNEVEEILASRFFNK